jgi:hypothetical protein
MEFLQSKEKYQQNIQEVEKRLLLAVLSATPNNGNLLAGWLAKNCVQAEGQIVDASVANILKAIDALDAAGLLDWEKAPVKKTEKKRPDFLQTNEGAKVNHARESHPSELDITMAQEKKRREALGDRANAELINEAVALIKRHTSTTHAKTGREREILKAEFDRLTALKAHPRDVLKGVEQKQQSFYDASVR